MAAKVTGIRASLSGSKYLLDAFEEMALMVNGILIVFQFNNLNSTIQDHLRLSKYLGEIKNNVSSDVELD